MAIGGQNIGLIMAHQLTIQADFTIPFLPLALASTPSCEMQYTLEKEVRKQTII